jgi:hypothetical protein
MDSTVHIPEGLTETATFRIAPSVRIGTSYNLIPNRFTVNAGVRLDPFSWTHTTTTQSRNGDGIRTTSTTKNGDGVVTSRTDTTDFQLANANGGIYTDISTVNSTWAGFSGRVGAGFLFNFNENIALDLLATTTNFNLNLTNVNVMLSFKF